MILVEVTAFSALESSALVMMQRMMRLFWYAFQEFNNFHFQDKSLLSVSQLCLVDLAGSERTNRSGTSGGLLKEAGENTFNSILFVN